MFEANDKHFFDTREDWGKRYNAQRLVLNVNLMALPVKSRQYKCHLQPASNAFKYV